MNSLRSINHAGASRGTSVAVLLAILALFAGRPHCLAFTADDLAGTWNFDFHYPGTPQPDFRNVLELNADGTVTYNGGDAGTFAVSDKHFTADLTGGPLDGEVASSGTTITGTANADDPFFPGTFTATKVLAGGIAVEQPEGTRLVSGSSTVDFGTGFTGGARPAIAKVKFIIKNTGTSPLAISGAAVSSGPFHVTAKPGKKVAPGKSTSVTLQMTPNGAISLDGNPAAPTTVQKGRLLIYSDDPKTPIFRIGLTGMGGGFAAP